MSAGFWHTCGVVGQVGAVWCWGCLDPELVSNGFVCRDYVSVPMPVRGMESGTAQVRVGTVHTCALREDGSVWCWGYNGFGELGDGTTTDNTWPVAVAGLGSDVTRLSAGSYHTCAITADGSAWCWGRNTYGQLGDSTTTNRAEPVPVVGLSGSTRDISAGWRHTCAVKTDGSAWCWGINISGELGDGTHNPSWEPVAVSGLDSGVVQIAAGLRHTCAIKSDGSAWCWGRNYEGQLGDGRQESASRVPVPVLGLDSGVSQVSVRSFHTCALKTDGSVWCWGCTHLQRTPTEDCLEWTDVPTPVPGLESGVVGISTGSGYACAAKEDGSAWCWGDNTYGELGDGTTADATTPVRVSSGP